ncbi:unnamed protein product, partial [Adineta steineri]
MATKRTLTLSDKVQLIRENEQHVNYRTLAENYQISIDSVSNIIKRKAEYLENYEQNENSNKKRNFRDEFNQQLDQKVYEWFVTQRSKNIPISGPLIQEQARQTRLQLDPTNNDDFKASNGWLEKFRKHHGITYKSICGESATVDASTVDDWLSRISSVIDKYDPSDIYNADETGKAAKPRCFKHLNIKQLPVTYRSNRTSWMTAALFDEFLQNLNNTMIKQKRKILLFIDHAPCHNSDAQYSNITIKFFPPNTTSRLQPLDQGIIKNFKCYYRQQLVKHVISRCAVANSPDDIIITALDAIHWTKSAWEAVTQSTIINTFRKAGFLHSNTQRDISITTNDINDDNLNDEIITDDATAALQNLDTLLTHLNIDGHSFTANEFIEIDSETPAFNEWNDTNDNLIVVDENGFDNITTEDNNDEDMPTEPPPKLTEAMEMIRRLHILAATQQPQLHSLISQLDSQLTQLFIDSKGVKQTTIDDFFHK